MRDDIIGALKNALQRGESIEIAARSLINSGYAAGEVDAAVHELTGSALTNTSTIHPNKKTTHSSPMKDQFIPPTNSPQNSKFPKPLTEQSIKPYKKPPGSNVAKIITLTSILVVLIFLLIITILYKENIVTFLQDLI